MNKLIIAAALLKTNQGRTIGLNHKGIIQYCNAALSSTRIPLQITVNLYTFKIVTSAICWALAIQYFIKILLVN